MICFLYFILGLSVFPVLAAAFIWCNRNNAKGVITGTFAFLFLIVVSEPSKSEQKWNDCTILPLCSAPGALAEADKPFPPGVVGYESHWNLRGDVVQSAQCIDKGGCIRTRYRIVYDCKQSRSNAPIGYCYSAKYQGQVITQNRVEVKCTCTGAVK